MERVLQATPATISNSWYEDGSIVDPGTVTVTITRADGTALYTDAATSGTGAAARSYTLSATDTELLDRLLFSWVSSTKGTQTTYVEVAGGYLFSIAELDALLQTPSSKTAAQKIDARTWAEVKIEQAIGKAFVPRYGFQTVDSSMDQLSLSGRPLRALRSLETRDGTTWTSQAVTDYDISYETIFGAFTAGYRNARIGYEYGEDFPPPHISEAAALWAKVKLVQGPVDDRELQRFISDTGAIVNLATPGRNSWSGIPEVDSVIEGERVPAIG